LQNDDDDDNDNNDDDDDDDNNNNNNDNNNNNSLIGPTENRILLGLRDVTATRHFKADRPPTESHQNQSLPKNTELKHRLAWTVEERREALYGATCIVRGETIFKSFRKYLSSVRGKHYIKELQKTAVLGTELVLRKAVTYKYERFDMGNIITCVINCEYRHQTHGLFQVRNCNYRV
jgi:hypothetical protein